MEHVKEALKKILMEMKDSGELAEMLPGGDAMVENMEDARQDGMGPAPDVKVEIEKEVPMNRGAIDAIADGGGGALGKKAAELARMKMKK